MSVTEEAPTRSSRAAGVSMFGGVVMATGGLFQFLEGLSAVRNDEVLVATAQYVYQFNTTVWGWIHLFVGAVAVVIGLVILKNEPWAYFAGIFVAVLSMVMQFIWLPYYPLWALIVIAIDFAVIWALSVRLREDWTLP